MNAKALLSSTAALAFAAAPALLHAAALPAGNPANPCTLLTPDEIKAVINSPVLPGKPGANDCTWRDAKGQDRVYLSVKDAGPEFHDFRNQMQASGHMTALTGVAEDAFYVSSAGSSAALYLLKKKHLLLLTVSGPDFSRAQNEASEKALAQPLLSRL